MTWTRTLLPLAAAALLTACGEGDAAEPGGARDIALDASHAMGAELDGRRYAAAGEAECRHAPEASIYGVPARMWMAQYTGEDDVQSMSLTLWRPTSGAADQLSLHISIDERSTRISTVEGGTIEGSATVTLTEDGEGGRITVQGHDADGRSVDVTVRCAHFAPLEAVGG